MIPPKCLRSTCPRRQRKGGMCDVHHAALVRQGLAGRVDAAPVIEHIKALQRLGWTLDQIAQAARVGVKVPQSILRTGRTKVTAATRSGILSVPLEPKASQRGVSALATRRRVQALMRLGWSSAAVGPRVGMTGPVLLASVAADRVSFALELRVKKVYKKLAVTPGPSRHARVLATRLGYMSPAAWTDETIGIPEVRVNLTGYDEYVVSALMAGEAVESARADRREAALRLSERGISSREVARVIGVEYSTACAYLREAA